MLGGLAGSAVVVHQDDDGYDGRHEPPHLSLNVALH